MSDDDFPPIDADVELPTLTVRLVECEDTTEQVLTTYSPLERGRLEEETERHLVQQTVRIQPALSGLELDVKELEAPPRPGSALSPSYPTSPAPTGHAHHYTKKIRAPTIPSPAPSGHAPILSVHDVIKQFEADKAKEMFVKSNLLYTSRNMQESGEASVSDDARQFESPLAREETMDSERASQATQRSIPELHRDDEMKGTEEFVQHDRTPIMPLRIRKSWLRSWTLWLSLLLSVFFILFVLFLLFWLLHVGPKPNMTDLLSVSPTSLVTVMTSNRKTCSTQQCINTAFRITSSLDESHFPCDSFYRHVCGRYNTASHDSVEEDVLKDVYDLLSAPSPPMSRSAQLTRTLYQACMDGKARSVLSSPLLSLLRNQPCSPIMDGCIFTDTLYSWERHSGMLDFYAGDWNIVNIGQDGDPQDRNKIILALRPPELTSLLGPIEQQLKQLTRPSATELQPLMTIFLRERILSPLVSSHLLADPRPRQAMLHRVAEFTLQLHALSLSTPPTRTVMSLKELFAEVPQMKWAQLFGADLSGYVKWKESDRVAVYNIEYFRELPSLLASFLPGDTANYLSLATAMRMREYAEGNGTSWRSCAQQLLPLHAMETVYVEEKKGVDVKKTRSLLEDLLSEFKKRHSKSARLEKVDKMQLRVGFPDRLTKASQTDALTELSVNHSDYFSSITSALRLQRRVELGKIGSSLCSDDSLVYPVLSPGILYDAAHNTMGMYFNMVPLSLLRDPISTPDAAPTGVVLATLGTVFLRAVAGVVYPERPEQSACFSDIFHSFLAANTRMEEGVEQLNLRESVLWADALQTTLAYYGEHMNSKEESLPGFDHFTPMQQFMITFLSMECSQLGVAIGSPYEAMLNTAVSNTRWLTDQYECTNRTAMHYKRTCV